MQAQKKLQNAQRTEFIGVFQSKSAIIAETKRLSDSLTTLGVSQRYLVNNRCEPEGLISASLFPDQAIVSLPMLPRSSPPSEQIAGAARLLFARDSCL